MINNRIRTLRKTLGLTQKEFAEKIGLKQNAISYLEKEGSNVTNQNIKSICSQFGVSERWLTDEEGDMFPGKESQSKKQQDFMDLFSELNPMFQEHLLQTAHNLLNMQNNMAENGTSLKTQNPDSIRYTGGQKD